LGQLTADRGCRQGRRGCRPWQSSRQTHIRVGTTRQRLCRLRQQGHGHRRAA
jgi:hypothetical protein